MIHNLSCSTSHTGVIKGALWGLNGAEEKYIRRVSGGNVKKINHFSDLEVDGRIILK